MYTYMHTWYTYTLSSAYMRAYMICYVLVAVSQGFGAISYRRTTDVLPQLSSDNRRAAPAIVGQPTCCPSYRRTPTTGPSSDTDDRHRRPSLCVRLGPTQPAWSLRLRLRVPRSWASRPRCFRSSEQGGTLRRKRPARRLRTGRLRRKRRSSRAS